MTRRIVCSVRDSATQLFGQPFYAVAVGAALRTFSDEVNRQHQDNQLYNHSEDFELHLLAEFDDETGEYFEPASGKRVLARGKDVKNPLV